jgi:uncharacterized glyoxalase superfamily protein PhnB
MMATRKTTKKTTRARAKARTAKRPARRPKAAPKRAAQKGLSMRSVSPSFTVDDVQKSLAWYRNVMGFAVGQRWEDGGKLMGLELKAGPVLFMIGQDDFKKGRDRLKGAGFRLYCQTDQDVDRLAEGIKSRGGALADEPRDEEWGGRAFTVVDPDGFKITISTPAKR